MKTCVSIVLVVLLLCGCTYQPVRIGSKSFAENRILAELMAQCLQLAGVRVVRRIPTGDTAATFEALRGGVIDLYPEYTGTGLVLLGLPPTADSAKALATMKKEFRRVGLTPLSTFGFESTYSVVIRKALAQRLNLKRITDLAKHASSLRLAVAEEFARRPTDGLQPFLDHFGVKFSNVQVIESDKRVTLYDLLIDKKADVVIGYSTDPQIIDYGLAELKSDGKFFPAYDALPVAIAARLQEDPRIAKALAPLAGRIDAAFIRELNRQVEVEGRNVRTVARQALIRLGLAKKEEFVDRKSSLIALQPSDAGTAMANSLLRAARRASRGRDINLLPSFQPLSAMRLRRARMALVPSIAQFEMENGIARLNRKLETVAVVGSYLVHALALSGGPTRIDRARSIVTGPVGSPSYKIALAVTEGSKRNVRILPRSAPSLDSIVMDLKTRKAAAAIVVAAAGRSDLAAVLSKTSKLRLINAANWWTGAKRLALPFLRTARIAESEYQAVREPITTVAMQATVVGPAPRDDIIGQQGPSSYTEAAFPVSDKLVLTLNRELGPHPDVGPHLRASSALKPRVSARASVLNTHPLHTILSLAILIFVVWAGWLFFRKDETRC